MGKLFKNGIDRIDWIVPSKAGTKRSTTVRFNESVLAKLQHQHKGRAHNEITMDGRLEMADFKLGDLKCLIHAPDGQRVTCAFTQELEEDYVQGTPTRGTGEGLGDVSSPV